MRSLSRMGLGLLGLAVLASSAAWADPPRTQPSATRPRRPLLHKPYLCAACQRAELQAKGIAVPPPPPLPPGGTVDYRKCDRCGSTGAASTSTTGRSLSSCTECANAANSPVMLGPDGTPMSVNNGGPAPGYAVAGGAPGYSVAGGAMPSGEPMPIGTVEGRYAYQNPGAAMGGMGGTGMPMAPGRPAMGAGAQGRGSGDPAVMPSSYTAAPEPYLPPGRNRPHVLTHLFGLDAIGGRAREERLRREREAHAAISYQPRNEPVTELPASMVYGR